MKRSGNEDHDGTDTTTIFDVLVIGGGVVGLSVLRSATLEGWKCVLVEAEANLLCWASGSNSGIVCTGADALPGTLERALIRDSISQIRPFCKAHSIPMRECGSLVCQWPREDGNDNDTEHPNGAILDKVLEESHEAGDNHASILSPKQVERLEPNISSTCLGAVHIPGEMVVDPWLFSIALGVHARENGARIITNYHVDAASSVWDGGLWTVLNSYSSNHDTPKTNGFSSSLSGAPRMLKARAIVNATGVWSDIIHDQLCQSISSSTTPITVWTTKPRRGQYRLFSSTDNTRIIHPIQPVPTQRTKGIFVFASLYDQIVVGPTALDQDSRVDRHMDPVVAEQLSQHAKRIVSDLDVEQQHIGDYVGIRPGTDQRDYQIHLLSDRNYVAAAGIRSTGLTASLGIGPHVVRLLKCRLLPPEEGSAANNSAAHKTKTTPLPHVADLVQDYHRRGNGFVNIHGYLYKLTHPITINGWKAKSGIAADPSADKTKTSDSFMGVRILSRL